MNKPVRPAEFDLAAIAAELGDVEVDVLVAIASRLKMGQWQYGKLKPPGEDRRDWVKEASDEAFDGCVYLALQMMKIKEGK